MLTYTQASKIVCASRSGRPKIKGNTWLERLDLTSIALVFHTTMILILHQDGSYTYNTEGHRTVTTKSRLNEYGPLSISQMQYQWYAGSMIYQDGMQAKSRDRIVYMPVCPECGYHVPDRQTWDVDRCRICGDRLRDAGLRPQ
jgi:hypothetical protein